MLKECLRHNIVPFMIEDSKKLFYVRGLSEWRNEKGWLTDTCLDGQDTFKRLLVFCNPLLEKGGIFIMQQTYYTQQNLFRDDYSGVF